MPKVLLKVYKSTLEDSTDLLIKKQARYNKLMSLSFALTGGRPFIRESFLSPFQCDGEWLANFQTILLFYMTFSHLCVFSIRQLRDLLAKL